MKILPAFNGDSIVITLSTKEGVKNILIDGGISRTIFALKKELNRIGLLSQAIDLLVVSHIDDDHIAGIIKLFGSSGNEKKIIKKVWFNSGTLISDFFNTQADLMREVHCPDDDEKNISIKQGNTLEKKIEDLKIWDKKVIHTGIEPIDFYGAKIHILSPIIAKLNNLNKCWEIEYGGPVNVSAKESDYNKKVSYLCNEALPKEDTAIPNGSSIAFLIEYDGCSIVCLADAHPSTIVESLKLLGYTEQNPLYASAVKVSHHGSSRNISEELLNCLKSKNFIISTNGSNHHLPDKLCLSKLIKSNHPGVKFYFNYNLIETQNLFTQSEMSDFQFECIDLSDSSHEYAFEVV